MSAFGLPLPRDLFLLLYVTVPCWAVTAGLFLAGEYVVKGWGGLSLVIYGAVVLAIWLFLVLALCIWILLRDGFLPSSTSPALVLMLALIGGAIWGSSKWLEQRQCTQSGEFFSAYANAAPGERSGMITANRSLVVQPNQCGLEMVQYWFGLDHEGQPVLPAAQQRLQGLRLLLGAGMTPTEAMMYEAARHGDREMIELYAAARATADMEVWPPRAASAALQEYETLPPQSLRRGEYESLLRLFVEGGADVTSEVDGLPSLASRMDRTGLPWRDWKPANKLHD